MPRAPKSADQLTSAWVAGMGAPNTAAKYKAGIAGVQDSPMARAASQEAMTKYINNVQASVTSGRRAAALNNASFSDWKNNAMNQGAMALSQGAQKAKNRFSAAMQKMAPAYAQASQAAAAIPHDGSMGSALARVQAAIQVMKQAAGK